MGVVLLLPMRNPASCKVGVVGNKLSILPASTLIDDMERREWGRCADDDVDKPVQSDGPGVRAPVPDRPVPPDVLVVVAVVEVEVLKVLDDIEYWDDKVSMALSADDDTERRRPNALPDGGTE